MAMEGMLLEAPTEERKIRRMSTFAPGGGADASMAWAHYDSDKCSTTQDEKTLTVSKSGTCVALGEPILASGCHTWTFVIENSFHNWGDGMILGVADANEELDLANLTGGSAIGLYARSGALVLTNDCAGPGEQVKMMDHPLDGCACGAAIKVKADLDRRSLTFRINGGPEVEAGWIFTKGGHATNAIRPWALLCFHNDKVRFTP
mmetsp:Transcript_65139/g.108216  ORF Transcript_65139/g.108216 Transcript_65139/m.108216 type:complete len:205 (+) Transcript_65139:118-732(+)|eukprot:CAMPEP_0119334012 /NCGR_PEP_ID=MMETSP1333-20130426/86498_1 /TAXON_ID=418940 /ORGANISM="Scyphosphaera apsteinii, Strain RCC1455" /LENGTH=204 /DNA_ID=CAMNT_0007344223 /DNA_START=109 /DNA_END=723 /DNA_ORIENTATION=-